ncbi:MAG: hypothetical protein ACRC8Y_22030 [Chroococcales cyanobacterium]
MILTLLGLSSCLGTGAIASIGPLLGISQVTRQRLKSLLRTGNQFFPSSRLPVWGLGRSPPKERYLALAK